MAEVAVAEVAVAEVAAAEEGFLIVVVAMVAAVAECFDFRSSPSRDFRWWHTDNSEALDIRTEPPLLAWNLLIHGDSDPERCCMAPPTKEVVVVAGEEGCRYKSQAWSSHHLQRRPNVPDSSHPQRQNFSHLL